MPMNEIEEIVELLGEALTPICILTAISCRLAGYKALSIVFAIGAIIASLGMLISTIPAAFPAAFRREAGNQQQQDENSQGHASLI
jgi:hypothetical protein